MSPKTRASASRLGCAVAALALATPDARAQPAPTHADEVAAFAALMAAVDTAAQRCPGVTVDEAVLSIAKAGLHIEDVDYFAFRKAARERADAIIAQLVGPADVARWCEEMTGLYGEAGTAMAGALRR